jgi:hypothetical protein
MVGILDDHLWLAAGHGAAETPDGPDLSTADRTNGSA